jgi:hypothetical protein
MRSRVNQKTTAPGLRWSAMLPYELESKAGDVLSVWRCARREPPSGEEKKRHGWRPSGAPAMRDVPDA